MNPENLASAILLLDDDRTVLHLLKLRFALAKIEVFAFDNAEEARSFISIGTNRSKIKVAIVDLFLDGDRGEHLSNNFIENELVPFQINYCRLTSAPSLVPEEFSGIKVFDKHDALRDVDELYKTILSLLPSASVKD